MIATGMITTAAKPSATITITIKAGLSTKSSSCVVGVVGSKKHSIHTYKLLSYNVCYLCTT